jgi:hypothetical protein
MLSHGGGSKGIKAQGALVEALLVIVVIIQLWANVVAWSRVVVNCMEAW